MERITVLRGAGTDQLGAPNSRNSFYVSSRPPLQPSLFAKLPIGSIKPRGWLRHQLVLMADGLTGRLPEVSPWCRAEGNAWLSPTGEGEHHWEELPYWLKGFGDLGYVLGDPRIIAEARKWIEGVLSSQRDDGYFGPRTNLTLLEGKPDLWPNMIMLNALQSFHEATGDPRVLSSMVRYFRWQLGIPKDDFLVPYWQKIRCGDNLESVHWLYNRTGEAWLLDLGRRIHENAADWTSGVIDWHGVNITQGFREPAIYFVQAQEVRFLEATIRNYETVMGLYGQVPGGMFGADENCRPGYTGPRQAAETCSMVEFMHSFEMLTRITGHPIWADRCEEVALNSLPASQPPDLKSLHYLTAPNMVQLDRGDKSPMLQNRGNMLAYDPYGYRCCQHNISHGWPYYAEELWLATADDGLCTSLYAPSEVQAKVGDGTLVTVVEETDYPFDEMIHLNIQTPKSVRFPLYLRIPQWCSGAELEINGKPRDAEAEPVSYIRIDRSWANGDVVTLRLPMTLTVKVWEKNRSAVSIHRGPLAYSLKIGERWERYGGTDEWPAYEVYPTTPWNYGLALDPRNPQASLEVVKKPGLLADQPFTPSAAPLEIKAKGRRIPSWKLEPNGLVGEIEQSPVKTAEPVEQITLVPMGCARLRISAFPTVAD